MALIFPPCEAHKEFASLLSFQVNEEFAGYKLSLFAFYFMRPMLGSGMMCNLLLKVVYFVDLWFFFFFMSSIGFMFGT